ncbi:uncharacterized protein BDV17DRAFT_241308 [Aspergillus undulatus]|uniref:uncharacterized protein n=1 Tax=Aspergillus undulatus TaxID=1810928 RepID=UPI003CCD4A8A
MKASIPARTRITIGTALLMGLTNGTITATDYYAHLQATSRVVCMMLQRLVMSPLDAKCISDPVPVVSYRRSQGLGEGSNERGLI